MLRLLKSVVEVADWAADADRLRLSGCEGPPSLSGATPVITLSSSMTIGVFQTSCHTSSVHGEVGP